MADFKPGDLVTVKSPAQVRAPLEYGRVYTVGEPGPWGLITIEEAPRSYGNGSKDLGWSSNRFELFEATAQVSTPEERTAESEWWDVPFDRVVVKGGGVDTAMKDALGLEVRVQVRWKPVA